METHVTICNPYTHVLKEYTHIEDIEASKERKDREDEVVNQRGEREIPVGAKSMAML